MRIAIASDHAGFALKSLLIKHLKDGGHEIVDDLVLPDDATSDLIHQRAPCRRELIEQLDVAIVFQGFTRWRCHD